MPEDTNEVQNDRTTPATSKDVAWALCWFGLFRASLFILYPAVYIAVGAPELSEAQQLGINFSANLLDLTALLGFGYLFSCRKYGRTIRDGFCLHKVPPRALLASVLIGVALLFSGLLISPIFVAPPAKPTWDMAPPLGLIAVATEFLVQPLGYVLFYMGFVYMAYRSEGHAAALLMTVTVYAFHNWFGNGHPGKMIFPAIIGTVLVLQTRKYNSAVPALATLTIHRLGLIALLIKTLFEA